MPTTTEELTVERIKPARLLPKRRIFVNEYLKTGSAAIAAKRAGYKPDNAAEQGAMLLSNPEVRRSIEAKLQKLEINAENVLQETAKLAFSNMGDYLNIGDDGLPQVDFTETTRNQYAALLEYKEDATGGDGDGERKRVIRRTIKLQSKAHALEMLAKHLHLLDVRVEVDVSDGLAGRLGGARYRTIDASPDAAQLLIDKHSEQLVTNELPSDDGQVEASPMSTSTPMSSGQAEPDFCDSLPPTPPTPGCVPHIPAEILNEVEDIGIIRPSVEGRDTSFDSVIPSATISPLACVFCSTHPCCCGTRL
jgi:phage terminase small subunit